MEMINIDILLKVIIPVLGAIITTIIVPLILKKTDKEQRDLILFWIRFAVNAAEQMEGAGLLVIPKKDYVVYFINKKGFDITETELDILIEALVKELNIEQTKGSQ